MNAWDTARDEVGKGWHCGIAAIKPDGSFCPERNGVAWKRLYPYVCEIP